MNGTRVFLFFSPREGLASVCVSPKAGFASVLFREVSLESSRDNTEARPSFGEQHRSMIPLGEKQRKRPTHGLESRSRPVFKNTTHNSPEQRLEAQVREIARKQDPLLVKHTQRLSKTKIEFSRKTT